MLKRVVVVLSLFSLLLLPVPARAHGGHTHKVLGTVTSLQLPHLEVKTTDGKTVMVMIDQKTSILRGKEKIDASALKVGDRVSIDAMQEKNMMMAQAIKLGAGAPATAAAKK